MAERYYTESHEWVQVDGDVATIGITDFAQSQLGDVVFLEFPSVGRMLEAGDSFGVVESVKAASDVYSPVTGEVTAANSALASTPELINQDAFGVGWMMRVRPVNAALLAELMSPADYAAMLAEGA